MPRRLYGWSLPLFSFTSSRDCFRNISGSILKINLQSIRIISLSGNGRSLATIGLPKSIMGLVIAKSNSIRRDVMLAVARRADRVATGHS